MTCGAAAGSLVETDLRYVWSFELEILGSNSWDIEDQRTLLEMVADGTLEPVIHRVCPISQFIPAMAELTEQAVVGSRFF